MDIYNKFKEEFGKRIILIPKKGDNPISEIKEHAHTTKICVCDFYIENSEEGEVLPWGINYQNILIIDHHAPRKEFTKYISSGSLAIKYVEENGPLPDDFKIVINHTDCDSIISMLIMANILPPEKRFHDAVIAADHFGHRNEIADVMQAIQYEDLDLIISSLEELINGEKLNPKAKFLYEKREEERIFFKELVNQGKVHFHKDVAYLVHEYELDPTLVASEVPESKIVFVAYLAPKSHDINKPNKKWFMRFRLGPDGEGLQLNKMDLPDFGGRWNAGSNRRTSGTDIEPKEYAKILQDKIDFFLANN